MNRKIPKEFLERTNLPVAILGDGRSGRGAQSLLKKIGWKSIIFDENGQTFSANDLDGVSLVIYSPGFMPNHPWLKLAQEGGKRVLSEVDFAAHFLDSDVVAITGTNGKSSLTTILAHVWKKLGRHGFACGNLGEPLSSVLANNATLGSTLFVEMSSFQTRGLQVLRPSHTLWTNFSTDHLNYHGTIREYFLCKYRLVERTDPQAVWLTTDVMDAARSFSIEIPVEANVVPEINLELPPDHFLQTHPQRQNLSLCVSWLKQKGFEVGEITNALLDYVPEPHRLTRVCSIDGIEFWNDSKSTNLGSVIAACRNFARKIIWIGGGQSKGENLNQFAASLKPFLSQAFLFGETSFSLNRSMNLVGIPSQVCQSLAEAISKAYNSSQNAVDIVFSPGFASFDHFQNYLQRGNSFIQLVLDLKKMVRRGTQEGTHFLTLSRKY